MSILIALIPMVAWGSIALVSGKLGGDANQQTLGMTMGAFVFALVTYFIVQPAMSSWILLIRFFVRSLLVSWTKRSVPRMKFMGVSVGLPISTGFQLILNTVAGAVFFHEWTKTKDFVLGFIALALLVLGAYLTARKDDDSGVQTDDSMLNFGKGLRALIFSTFGYGVYTIIITWAGLDPLAIILPQSIGMLVGASFFAFRKTSFIYVWRNMASGLLWGIGNVCMLLSVQNIGLAIGFSLSQMGIIISTLGGIFLLGERKTKKELYYVIIGCLLIIVGGVVLGYMKA